jgi:serine/threonine protein kinase/Tol biopolymer transport system component
MTLEPGARFGSYEIVAPLGAGGMGEVWRARDTRLGRDVALKLVGEAFVSDPERVARFDREAKLLASLQHPHIAVLYGQEEIDGRRVLAMELVEGVTLAERFAGGALPAGEALSLAHQVAEALEHAHAHGIVHRDLKPANVKVTPDGQAKVLDFGLGKSLAPERGADPMSSPTLTRQGTGAGVVLGTASYMSPEQARGQTVDRRSDVWSFGVILFELLTGTRLFRGDTMSDVLASVLTAAVEWDRLPAGTPPAAGRLLRRCLERDPRERLHDFADVRIELTQALKELERPAISDGSRRRLVSVLLPWGIAVLATAAVVALVSRPSPSPHRVSRLLLRLQPRPLTVGGIALSPDGARLAYVADGQIHVRALDGEEVRALPEAVGSRPFFSPDGQWIGFVGPDELPSRVSISGGPVVRLAEPPHRVDQCTWAPDDTILCTQPGSARPGELLRIPARGGPPQPLPASAQETTGRVGWPSVLPGGRAVLLTVFDPAGGGTDDATIVAQRLDTGDRRVVVQGGAHAAYSPTGHLVFGRGTSLFAVAFDPTTLVVRGTPLPVAEHVSRDTVRGGRYALAGDGTLVYFPETGGDRPLLWVDRHGQASRIPEPPHTYIDPRVSPDGSRIVVQGADADNDIWVGDLARGSLTRLTFDPGEDETPVWSPDGAWVAWTTQRAGRPRQVMRRRADASGSEIVVWSTERHVHLYDWSPDGRYLLATQDAEAGSRDIWVIPLTPGEAHPLLPGPFEKRNPRCSPDGRWLVYSSNESGRFEVYILRFPELDHRVQVSIGGGDRAVWGAGGREIVFHGADGEVASARFSPGTTGRPRVGQPVTLFPDRYGMAVGRTSHVDYDIQPDGNRFVMVGSQDTEAAVELGVVLNWFEELKRLPPPRP